MTASQVTSTSNGNKSQTGQMHLLLDHNPDLSQIPSDVDTDERGLVRTERKFALHPSGPASGAAKQSISSKIPVLWYTRWVDHDDSTSPSFRKDQRPVAMLVAQCGRVSICPCGVHSWRQQTSPGPQCATIHRTGTDSQHPSPRPGLDEVCNQ